MNSLLDQISKCNDIIKSNQELSKNNVKPLENKILIKQDRFIETTATTNKESKKSSKKKKRNNETPFEEKSEKCTSQQNTSISSSNNNKSDKTKSDKSSTSKTDNEKDHKQKSVIILGDSMSVVGRSRGNRRETVKYM